MAEKKTSTTRRAVAYAVLRRGEIPEFVDEVEKKHGYKVVKTFVDWADVIATKGRFKELSEMLTLIHRGELKVDAVFVPSVRVFRNLDLYLFVKRLLELNGVELRSIRRREKHTWKTQTERLRETSRRNFIIEMILYAMIWGAGIYLMYILREPILTILIVATLALTGYTYYTKTYKVRKRLLKKLEELDRVDTLKNKRNVRFNITLKGVEVIETPF
ncbi:MAG: hypothetical protein DRO10_02700 [Thermoprotei archaeon]|nr:MAG: hypothetical protein DRO10_02700 [Thermoprotei archaeon]